MESGFDRHRHLKSSHRVGHFNVPRHQKLLWATHDADLTYRDYDDLSRIGYEVKTATTGVMCLRHLHEWKPEILFLGDSFLWNNGLGILSRTPAAKLICSTRDCSVVLVSDCPSRLIEAGVDVSRITVLPKLIHFSAMIRVMEGIKESAFPQTHHWTEKLKFRGKSTVPTTNQANTSSVPCTLQHSATASLSSQNNTSKERHLLGESEIVTVTFSRRQYLQSTLRVHL